MPIWREFEDGLAYHSPQSVTPMPFDTRAFRDALGCFPTGVVVVTGEATIASLWA
jgi:flavin reductase (DIM6/NTAB) family NADH-FMN oxidoreductase RutF